MNYSMQLGLAVLALLAGELYAEESAPALTAVVVTPGSSRAGADGGPWTFSGSSGRPFTRELEMGGTVDGGTVQLLPVDGTQDRFKVQVQFETRVTVFEQGPGPDVRDLKYFNSDWMDAPTFQGSRFLVPTVPATELRRFPRGSAAEPFAELLSRGIGWWAPPGAAAMVDTSTIRVRVLVRANATWSEVTTIAFKMPAPIGC